jgi:hypothetical protein
MLRLKLVTTVEDGSARIEAAHEDADGVRYAVG